MQLVPALYNKGDFGLEAAADDGPSISSSMRWASAASISRQLVSIAALLILARILTPRDYGQYAVVASISTFAFFFTEGGMGSAIISAPALTTNIFRSAVYANIALSILGGLAILGLSVPLSWIYTTPDFQSLLMVVGLGLFLSWGVAHLALLERHRLYRRVAVIEILAVFAGQAITIALALLGNGAMSLAVGAAATFLVSAVLAIVLGGGLPPFRFKWDEVKPLASFGGHVLLFNVINYWSRNVDNLLLGIRASAPALGAYSRAYQLMLLPLQQITLVVGRVSLPYLSRLSKSREEFRARWLSNLNGCLMIGLPIAGAIFVVADPLVRVTLGPRWGLVAILLKVLSVSIPPQLVASTTGPAYQALGRPRRLMVIGLANTAVVVGSIVAGLHWGVTGVAWGVVVGYYANAVIVVRDLATLLTIPMRMLGIVVAVPTAATAIASVISTLCLESLGLPSVPELAVAAGIFLTALGMAYLTLKPEFRMHLLAGRFVPAWSALLRVPIKDMSRN